MNWNKLIRQSHRWLAMAFTLAVIANFIAIGTAGYIDWLGYIAVSLIFLMLLSGLYLFILPYLPRRRAS